MKQIIYYNYMVGYLEENSDLLIFFLIIKEDKILLENFRKKN